MYMCQYEDRIGCTDYTRMLMYSTKDVIKYTAIFTRNNGAEYSSRVYFVA